jgi:hypothetical protein
MSALVEHAPTSARHEPADKPALESSVLEVRDPGAGGLVPNVHVFSQPVQESGAFAFGQAVFKFNLTDDSP